MGRNREEIRVTVSLSSHNSEQDRIDEDRWEGLKDRIRVLCDEYSDIQADVW